jgi:hypothetical protein
MQVIFKPLPIIQLLFNVSPVDKNSLQSCIQIYSRAIHSERISDAW